MKTEEKHIRWYILGAVGGIWMAAGDWLLVVIPDIAQARGVPAATWMSVMSQSSTNSAIVLWCAAAAVYGEKNRRRKAGAPLSDGKNP